MPLGQRGFFVRSGSDDQSTPTSHASGRRRVSRGQHASGADSLGAIRRAPRRWAGLRLNRLAGALLTSRITADLLGQLCRTPEKKSFHRHKAYELETVRQPLVMSDESDAKDGRCDLLPRCDVPARVTVS